MKATDRINEVRQLMENLKQDYPAEINAFLGFMEKAEGNPALDSAQKELINVALSVAAQCEWCIALHVKNAVEAGASRDEIMSAGFMAVIMHGGPALMYLVPLSRALDEFLPETPHG
ncbi:carboxymuconolactone decarboxylase family protein [Acidithiobacillus montserratensis]|uniref:Carboxymuconolactone decarboxylase family protein n=1 Tax=Acidithiobacillus montserratensis TaxID=2729135 RepID=A0ACD5HC63_9PROT|nr:carboxymuconolactone decarboxylase family protein [Acidithiobacillus montserratensis]MBN2680563.1 carboxymuconolactone decarboxylase family protein [Acidithiobacillaceae bacterium]MBU2746799.1 carboxymuconolactone decarboxylase family protein [Acidithiobacillus montserratensis]